MIIAIDFDGTIVEHEFPCIGKPRLNAIKVIKRLIAYGHLIIVWTCRDKAGHLDQAIDFLKENDIFNEGH